MEHSVDAVNEKYGMLGWIEGTSSRISVRDWFKGLTAWQESQQDVAGSPPHGRICTDEQTTDDIGHATDLGKTTAGCVVIRE
jgi:hypothetical protein